MNDNEISKMAQFGIAALLPGMQKMIDVMQAYVEEQRAILRQLQGLPEAVKRGRPVQEAAEVEKPAAKVKKYPGRAKGITNYWDRFTPEERSVEMKRRMKIRRKNDAKQARAAAKETEVPTVRMAMGEVKAKMHPRDPRHPDHKAWVEDLRATRKREWKNMSPEQRQARIDRMNAGKKAVA